MRLGIINAQEVIIRPFGAIPEEIEVIGLKTSSVSNRTEGETQAMV